MPTRPYTRRPRTVKPAAQAQAELPMPLMPTAAQAEATAPTEQAEAREPGTAPFVDLAAYFLPDGSTPQRDRLRYNQVTGGAYAFQLALFRAIARLTKEDVDALTLEQRKAMFGTLRRQADRYYGTAVRFRDDERTGAKAGDPLPRLSFGTKGQAVEFREALLEARGTLKLHVFGSRDAKPPVEVPEEAAA